MAESIDDYLIDQSGVDWSKTLASWAWLLPAEFTLWLVNRFGDLFLVQQDGSIWMLDIGAGTLTRVAQSREEFGNKLDAGNAAEWLMIPLVDRLADAGFVLQPGHCYGFKTPPVLGGRYEVENCCQLSVGDYISGCGRIHEQLRNVPDGTEIRIKPT